MTSFSISQQAEVAQGVPGRFKATDILDFRHYEGGRSSAIRTGRLYPRRNPWYSFTGAESTPGHMVPRKKSPVTASGIDPETVQLVAQSLNHYATPDPDNDSTNLLFSVQTPTQYTQPPPRYSATVCLTKFVTSHRRRLQIEILELF